MKAEAGTPNKTTARSWKIILGAVVVLLIAISVPLLLNRSGDEVPDPPAPEPSKGELIKISTLKGKTVAEVVRILKLTDGGAGLKEYGEPQVLDFPGTGSVVQPDQYGGYTVTGACINPGIVDQVAKRVPDRKVNIAAIRSSEFNESVKAKMNGLIPEIEGALGEKTGCWLGGEDVYVPAG
jgi:hypothetical protein